MLADGAAAFTSAIGLEMDGSGFGLGKRSQRYSMVLEDGVVKELNIEPGPGVDVSACEIILNKL
jgi:peroxiredoxin